MIWSALIGYKILNGQSECLKTSIVQIDANFYLNDPTVSVTYLRSYGLAVGIRSEGTKYC